MSRALFVVLACLLSESVKAAEQPSVVTLEFPDGTAGLEVGRPAVEAWVSRAEHAVAVYFGRMTIGRVLVRVAVTPGGHGVMRGTTWGDRAGYPGFIRIELGQHTTQGELDDDWTMTHELVHTMFPDLPDEQTWLSEGVATYVEPIARVQTHELTEQRIWGDMVRDMPQGEPANGDRGLDRTATWARTYWGGALFLLDADVAIRTRTANKRGLRDALRAIADAHGTIDNDWPVKQVIAVGDAATGTTVLAELYARHAEQAVAIDLDAIWKRLGVVTTGNKLERLDPNAIRSAIVDPRR